MSKIFFNKTIAITRGEKNNSDFTRIVKEQGGTPISLPTTKLTPLDSHQFIKKFIDISTKKYAYYIFMSPNSVEIFVRLVRENNLTHLLQEQLKKSDVIAIGPSTRKKLEVNDIYVKWVPSDYSSNGILKLIEKLSLKPGSRIMIPRSGASNSFLKDRLSSMGLILDEFYIYFPQIETLNQTWIEFSKEFENNRVQVLIFTSPSAVRFFFSIMNNMILNFRGYLKNVDALISIGPNTTRELVSRNISPVESGVHTIEGTIELAKRILSKK
ncbi:MAG TPA: uroporphyrinogen-III synthase [Nitrososphaeraceae archaeon]